MPAQSLRRALVVLVCLSAQVAVAQETQQPPAAPPQAAPPAPPEGQLELPAPPEDVPVAPQEKLGEISLEDWTRDDWTLVQPKVALLELDGYFRLRGDLLRKLDFDNDTQADLLDVGGEAQSRYPRLSDGQANFTSTNIRLRLEPTINVSEDIHLVATLDVLDNHVLGSTPNDPYGNEGVPVNVLADGQRPPRRGENAFEDSIVLKRAYARVTALNDQLELRFGRMPSHFGLGVLSNSGDCLDCDFGDVVDRIELSFKAAELLFIPAYDWVATGPTIQPFGSAGGQPIDAITWDDVEQYSLRVLRLDDPAEIKERVLAGERVFNYGLWIIYRRQFRDLPDSYYATTPVPGETAIPTRDVRRDANVFTGDLYLTLEWGEVTLAAETVAVWGSFKDTALGDTLDTTRVYQLGGALEAKWRFKGEYQGTALGLKAGGASGDSARYFGALDRAGSQRGGGDDNLNNFQFSPDYHVDLLMFRRIIGTVTDAWYVRPEVSHTFDNDVTGSFGAVYSQAIFKRSTPSAARQRDQSRSMGLELDAELAYGSDESPGGGAFRGALAGALLFPFGAFDNPNLPSDERGGSFAWTLLGRLYVTF